jgi:hypothetical protein
LVAAFVGTAGNRVSSGQTWLNPNSGLWSVGGNWLGGAAG